MDERHAIARLAHFYHKGVWDHAWARFLGTYSEYSGHEGSKNVALQPTWLLSHYLRTIRGPSAWAQHLNSPITRRWGDFTTVALGVLSPDPVSYTHIPLSPRYHA